MKTIIAVKRGNTVVKSSMLSGLALFSSQLM